MCDVQLFRKLVYLFVIWPLPQSFNFNVVVGEKLFYQIIYTIIKKN